MFWKKKTPPRVTERELEIINNIIKSMTDHPDQWTVSSDGYGNPKLTCRETLHQGTTNEIIYVASTHYPSLTFNTAELNITSTSKKRLNYASSELVQEKLLQSLIPKDILKD